MVAREAMAYGRAVVASPVGGLVDAVDDDVDGLLATSGMLRAAIELLLADAHLRGRLGRAAREKARREWSTATATNELLAVYEAPFRETT
jgi:glycosyltransferase involved in cell wall biosynthesis